MTDKRKRKPGGGAKRMSKNEKTVEVGIRCPESLKNIYDEAVEMLKSRGYDTDRSKVIRCIMEYRQSNIVGIYQTSNKKPKKD